MVYSLSKTTSNYHYERSIPCRNFVTILLMLAQNLLFNICAELIEFIKKITTSHDFIDRHRQSPSDFTRNRKLPAHCLITFLLSLVRGSYQNELDRFFSILDNSDIPKRFVTKAAFAKARVKLKHQAFIELNQRINQFFENHFKPKTWHDFRLLVTDGSTIRLPHTEDISNHFGVWRVRQGRPSPMARISQLYDPLNNFTVEAAISPKCVGEREMAANHCLSLMPKDLMLIDRGYPAWWLFALILSMNADFCGRISKKWKIVQSFLASGKKQCVIYLPIPTSSVKIAQQMRLDLKPLKLRLIRIDNADKPIVLITSLTDQRQYRYPIFSDLYHLRWPVEEDYKRIKCRIELENFSGKSALSVYQDFHAKVLMKNLVSLFALPVNDALVSDITPTRKYDYQVNSTQAFAKCKDLIPLLFQRSKRKIRLIFDALFAVLKKTIEPIRPGRKYPRKHRVSNRKYYMNFKPIA